MSQEKRDDLYQEVSDLIIDVLPDLIMDKLELCMANQSCPHDKTDCIEVAAVEVAHKISEKIRHKYNRGEYDENF